MGKAPKNKNLRRTQAKEKTANGAKHVNGLWCTQQDSNLWPFDS